MLDSEKGDKVESIEEVIKQTLAKMGNVVTPKTTEKPEKKAEEKPKKTEKKERGPVKALKNIIK